MKQYAAQVPIHENVELRHLNTFHVPARARYHARVNSLEELRAVLAWLRERNLPHLLLGQGSNVLFRHDYEGLVIELHLDGIEVLGESDEYVELRAMAGVVWHELVLYAVERNYVGLENLALIPGTVGAAPVQNIGAYGRELKDLLIWLDAMELATGEMRRFSREECGFAYRSSVFKRELAGRYVICSVALRLARQGQPEISYPALRSELAQLPVEQLTPRVVCDAVCRIRRSKLPDPATLGNAGSFFWNPLVSREQHAKLKARWPDLPGFPDGEMMKIPAAWLIERAGWKGFREGDVGVHRDHALVLVNHGEATGEALLQLARRIQASVQELFGIELQPEVRIV